MSGSALTPALPLPAAPSPPAYIYNSTLTDTRIPLVCWYGHRCNRSDCPTCQNRKSHDRLENIHENIHHKKNLHHLVLTIETTPDLTSALTHLRASFKRLRRFWKTQVRGGVWNLHVKHNPKNDHWNVHLDMTVEAIGLTTRQLENAWLEITGTSHNLHLKAVRDSDDDRCRLTTYQTHSAIRDIAYDHSLVKRFIHANTRNRRQRPQCGRFGKWVNVKNDKTRWKKTEGRKARSPSSPTMQDSKSDAAAAVSDGEPKAKHTTIIPPAPPDRSPHRRIPPLTHSFASGGPSDHSADPSRQRPAMRLGMIPDLDDLND